MELLFLICTIKDDKYAETCHIFNELLLLLLNNS